MNTRVFRLDLASGQESLDKRIAEACDKQLAEGYRLASTFLWSMDLILIFQNVDNSAPPNTTTS